MYLYKKKTHAAHYPQKAASSMSLYVLKIAKIIN